MNKDLDFYFKHIKTEQQYWDFRRTGMAFEIFPLMPQSWEQHIIVLAQREAGKLD